MNKRIQLANDRTLLVRAIQYHIDQSDRAFAEGDCEFSRIHRKLVDSLRAQLSAAGDTDGISNS
jgi:hypothetical protein